MERTAALMLLAGLACEAPAPPAPAPEPVAREILEAQELLPPPPPSSWPSEVVGLRETIRGFRDFDACLVSLRERTPTEVSEAISDLAYDAFFQDVCASMAAVHDGSVEGCDALSVSSARRGCRRRLALFHGEPRACPTSRVGSGREAVCVAWAARDEDLCQAASTVDRARCQAVLSADPARCSSARGGDRVRCEAEIERYADALGQERRHSPAATRPRRLRVEVDGVTLTRDTVARGVRLVNEGCRTRVELAGEAGGLRLLNDPGTFRLELSVSAALELPASLDLGAEDALLEVTTDGRGHLSSAGGARGRVVLTAFERRLGGAVRGSIEGALIQAGEPVPVRGRFATFVRDLDPLPERCRR